MKRFTALIAISLATGMGLFIETAEAKPKSINVNCDAPANNNIQAAVDAADGLSLDIIVFSEIHSTALRCLSLQRNRFWSRGTSQRQETLGARL